MKSERFLTAMVMATVTALLFTGCITNTTSVTTAPPSQMEVVSRTANATPMISDEIYYTTWSGVESGCVEVKWAYQAAHKSGKPDRNVEKLRKVVLTRPGESPDMIPGRPWVQWFEETRHLVLDAPKVENKSVPGTARKFCR